MTKQKLNLKKIKFEQTNMNMKLFKIYAALRKKEDEKYNLIIL